MPTISKEMELGAMIGPFESIPFSGPVAISPLSSRKKKDSDKRRIIMDCSWPIGVSLNDGIDKDSYLGRPIKLVYPTVTNLACKLHNMATDSSEPILLYKEDMDRAFRQLPADPKSVPLLGFRWKGRYYYDLVMMMGCKIAPCICQRTTDMIAYIHSSMGHYLLNYVDDFLGAEYQGQAQHAHQSLIRLMRDIGAARSSSKSVAPTQVIEFVGNLFDTHNMTIGVTPTRKVEILRLLEQWRTRTSCTRNQLETLVGKLQFMSNCIKPGRLFVSRLLLELKAMQRGKYYHLNDQAKKDIKWWYLFLPGFEGTSIMWLVEKEDVDGEIATDACLSGAGGISHNQYYRKQFPKWVKQNTQIAHLEMWAIIIAVKLWGKDMKGLYKLVLIMKQFHKFSTQANHRIYYCKTCYEN